MRFTADRTLPQHLVRRVAGILAVLAFALPVWGYAATQTRVAAFEYDAATGLLVKEIVEPDNPELCIVTVYSRDAYGNKTGSTTRNCNGSAGSNPGVNSEAAAPGASSNAAFSPRSSTTVYDARGQFPVVVTNALGQSETRTYDARFGQVTSLTGPNGLTTTWTYDGFGRKLSETRADGTITTWAYTLCAGCGGLSNAAYTITVSSTGAPTVITYYDSLERVIRTQTTGFDGTSAIYQDTVYDNLGRVSQKSAPYYAGQTAYWTRFSYDVLGRAITETAPDNSVSTIAYQGLTTQVTDAANQTQIKTKNSQGQLASVTDPLGNKITYTYDPQGNLIKTTDALGNVVTLGYDLKGRKVSMSDPDMGNWQYHYNALGELVGQTDAKGQVSVMAYDLLGRMIRRSEADLVATWFYDKKQDGSTCGTGVGKLCEARADNGYRRMHHYDPLGRPDSTSTTLDTTYTSSVTYDALGRVATRAWPTGFAVKYVYTSLGYLKEVRDNASDALYWQANTLDATGHLLTQTQGNNVVTQRTYDPANGRLTGILAGAGNGVQNLVYAYDAMGNLITRQDNAAASLESFAYDSLNRLTAYTLQGPGAAGIQARTVSYDAISNIVAKSDTGTYYYAPGTPPHAVTSVTGGPNKTYAHAYDANGNLIYTAINDLGSGQTSTRFETYTSFNMPLVLSQGLAGQGTTLSMSFVYGPEHQRTKQDSSVNGTTYYLNGTDGQALDFEKEVKASGIENKHYITAGGAVVALYTTRSNGSQSLRYFHLDHLGSTSVVTDEAGNVVERLAYDPWGKRQYADGGTPPEGYTPASTDRGFTMHEHLDEMGIIHMNGRVYDPSLGRFMSADPYIQSPDNLVSYNRYAYVWNNPLGSTDPSGYFNLGKALGLDGLIKSITHSKIGRIAITVAASYYIGLNWMGTDSGIFGANMGWQNAMAGGFAGGFVGSGGDFKAGLQGAFSASLFFGAGSFSQYQGWLDGDLGKVLAHAAAGCVGAAAGGGSCGSGALSAGFAEGVGGNLKYESPAADFIMRTVIGGTASVLGGGKFANGAQTAAFGYLFNHCAHDPDGCSFWKRVNERYAATSKTIDSAIDSALPWPVNSPEGLATAAGGGAAAKDYGGRTVIQEGAKLAGEYKNTSFSLFRTVARPDIIRVGATSAVNALAVNVAWKGGLYVGSIISEMVSGPK